MISAAEHHTLNLYEDHDHGRGISHVQMSVLMMKMLQDGLISRQLTQVN